MFKRASCENEVAEAMTAQLKLNQELGVKKHAFSKLAATIDSLASAADVFEAAGNIEEANAITSLLASFADKKTAGHSHLTLSPEEREFFDKLSSEHKERLMREDVREFPRKVWELYNAHRQVGGLQSLMPRGKQLPESSIAQDVIEFTPVRRQASEDTSPHSIDMKDFEKATQKRYEEGKEHHKKLHPSKEPTKEIKHDKELNADDGIVAAAFAELMKEAEHKRCNCENSKCHPDADCKKPAGDKKAQHVGAICDDCAKKMPKEYMKADDHIVAQLLSGLRKQSNQWEDPFENQEWMYHEPDGKYDESGNLTLIPDNDERAFPEAADGRAWEKQMDDHYGKDPFAEDLPPVQMPIPQGKSKHKHVSFDDSKHLPSAEYEARHNLDNWNTDPEGFEQDAPLHDDNTRTLVKHPSERMFKHPMEDDEDANDASDVSMHAHKVPAVKAAFEELMEKTAGFEDELMEKRVDTGGRHWRMPAERHDPNDPQLWPEEASFPNDVAPDPKMSEESMFVGYEHPSSGTSGFAGVRQKYQDYIGDCKAVGRKPISFDKFLKNEHGRFRRSQKVKASLDKFRAKYAQGTPKKKAS